MTITEIDRKLAALPERELFVDGEGQIIVGGVIPAPRSKVLTNWERKALRRLKRVGSAACDYNWPVWPVDDPQRARVRDALSGCDNADDIRTTFARERRIAAEREAGE